MPYIHNQQEVIVKDACSKEQVEKVSKLLTEDKYKSQYPILEEVAKILEGDRRDSYGEAVSSFTRIADYWNDYIYHKYKDAVTLTPYDIAMMMALFKIAREENNHKHDNIVDAIGYLALANKLIEKE